MSVFTQGNMMSVYVQKDIAPTAIANLTSDLYTSMADSQVVAVGRPINGTSERVIQVGASAGTYDYFRFAYKVNSNLVYGPKVDLKNLTNVSAATTLYSTSGNAPQEQVWTVGYWATIAAVANGASLDVSQSNEFIFTIAYDNDDILWSEQKLRNSYDYYSASPTQQGLAQSMTAQINYKEYQGRVNGTGRMVRAEMFNSGAAADLTSTPTMSVVNGSDIVTLSASSASITVNSLIRIGYNASSLDPDTGASLNGGSASGRGVGVPVYTITEVNMTGSPVGALPANSFRIHTPFQGPTNASLATGSANVGMVTAGASWGFAVTGLPLTWQKDFFKYNKVKFHFDTKGFGQTVVTKVQESRKGNGFWQEVAEYESFAAGNEGILNRMKIPLPVGRTYTDVSGSVNYNTTAIFSTDYTLTGASSSITGNSPMRIQQFVFFPNTNNGTTGRSIISSQLNGLLGASL